jgi:cytochrome c peroxidase
MKLYQKAIAFLVLLVLFSACKKDAAENEPDEVNRIVVPEGFAEITFPEDNAYSQPRWELGKKLFFDPVLSKDSTISCASCHNPALAFSDSVALSLGVKNRPGTRNSPTLTNVAYHPYFTREGGVPSLEMQVLVPIQEHNEFDFNIIPIAERLKNNSDYVALSKLAYNRTPDPFVVVRAIATFERSLISGNSAYDKYTFQNESLALTENEKAGMDLFFSQKTQCSQCHSGFNFSNYVFENNGLYNNYTDEGRRRLTNRQEDFALFKVPTLRNIGVTAPYMHDGSLATLEDVVEHYNSGGKNNPQKSKHIQPLNLTEIEKEQLVAFLKSLTDYEFINNPKFKP